MAGREPLTVDRFIALTWKRLLIRGKVTELPADKEHWEKRRHTKIVLYARTTDVDHNPWFIEVVYESTEPRSSCDSEVGLGVRFLGKGSWDEGMRQDTSGILDQWSDSEPSWFWSNKPVHLFTRTDLNWINEIPSTNRHLMQHFARMHQRVAYEARDDKHAAWMLGCVHYWLDKLIRDQNREWERLVGQVL